MRASRLEKKGLTQKEREINRAHFEKLVKGVAG